LKDGFDLGEFKR